MNVFPRRAGERERSGTIVVSGMISCPYKQLRYLALAPSPLPCLGEGSERGRGEGSYNKSLTGHDMTASFVSTAVITGCLPSLKYCRLDVCGHFLNSYISRGFGHLLDTYVSQV